ncbi:leucine-rich repeat domain-containing protein [Pseudomonas sp. GM48]|uniref:leucine-rich repeat domain-containing protein n=1 Tax=Pseudomonas sp. GM48 TaxID=1144330 RepID=UPI0002705224|nr:leucine-rich repeat domain-containing protein [Pseudomonas sp. GM48]EJM60154.1 hypothetical protein PMI28_01359 [Pseudomonas sp. GM48]
MFEVPAQQRPDSKHRLLIEEKIPDWLIQALPHRRQALQRTPVVIPDWYRAASAASHAQLAQAVKASWLSQTRLDKVFEPLADARRFAEPLLRKALKDRFDIELDVARTYLRLYLPKGVLTAYQVKTLSLLDAALHNFEKKESTDNYFGHASGFINEPDNRGHFKVLPINERISISAFVSMCRELDIGGQYSRQLQALLLPGDAVAKAVLELRVKASQKDAFRAAVLLARMKGDIGADSQQRLLQLADGVASPALHCHQLQIMTARLTGIMVLAGDLERSSRVEPLVVYIPDDPQHPLKEYPSTQAFRATLTEQLRTPAYQAFFARFIAHEQRGQFFAMLDQRLNVVTWHPPQANDPQPAWRRTPVDNPALHFDAHRTPADPWQWLYQDTLNKILNDARNIAVPTADEDRKSRWALWDSLQNVASIVMQVATLVAIPFVPFLGELMLAYTAYQLLDETFTGILDWADGQVIEAADHLLTIAENMAQLAAFGVAAAVAGKVLAIKPSEFVEGLKPVELYDGRIRLWNPDLQPYEQPASLPLQGEPDELGLQHQAGKTFLTLDARTYEVAADTQGDAYHVRHPQRPNAYRPQLTHNNTGAWAHEVERPMEWQGAQLFRRLGHSVAEFSDETARHILTISGVDEAMLRHLHVHARRPPALLKDTVRRFKLDRRIEKFRVQMSSSDPAIYTDADAQLQLHVLKGQQVNLSQSQLRHANVIQTVVETLEEGALKKLLGLSPAPGDSLPAIPVRAALLRIRMADWVQEQRVRLFNLLEDSFELSADAPTRQIRRIFPELPRSIAEEFWSEASASDRLHLLNKPGIPRHMAHEALFYLREVRLSRAYEGLYLEARASVDSDVLALHMLETVNGWSPDIRIEVRDGHFDGALLDSIGGSDVPIRKVMVRQNVGYRAYSGAGEELHGFDDFFSAVQHALPDAQRKALGLPHVGQGGELKLMLRKQAPLPRSQLRALLGQPPLDPALRSPMALAVGRPGYLLGGGDFKPLHTESVAQRMRRLFPTLNEEELETLRRELLHTEPLVAMARLENEYVALVNDLQVWVGEVPSHDPLSGIALTAEGAASQRRYREAFADVVQASWSRRLTAQNRFDTGRFFSKLDILGDLPELSADFSHVSEFLLINTSPFLSAGKFLKGFTGLKYLTIRGVRLDGFPIETFQMRSLISLTLDDCNLRLSEATVEGLAHMESLEELELDNNLLGLTPDVGYIKGLQRLSLKSTGLAEAPHGLFNLEKLRFADLTFNRIVDLPDELFDVPDTQPTNFNFCDNPLSDESRQRISRYVENSGLDRKVLIQFDDEVSAQSEDEFEDGFNSESDESGVESGEESDAR